MNSFWFWVAVGLVGLALIGDPEGLSPQGQTQIFNTNTGQWEVVK